MRTWRVGTHVVEAECSIYTARRPCSQVSMTNSSTRLLIFPVQHFESQNLGGIIPEFRRNLSVRACINYRHSSASMLPVHGKKRFFEQKMHPNSPEDPWRPSEHAWGCQKGQNGPKILPVGESNSGLQVLLVGMGIEGGSGIKFWFRFLFGVECGSTGD